ncbi:hypothetical protein BH20ACI4_BH20ACI4_09680 [soil metagenome]
MKKKLIACGLSLMLLFAQNIFVFSQVANGNLHSNDELINLYDDPDMIAVVNVRKMLTQTAPILLAVNPATIEKIKTAMKTVENDTGVNPYSVEKFLFGMKIQRSDETAMMVLQTLDAADGMAENMYQRQVVNAKFAPEINPLKNRIDLRERQIKTIETAVIPENQPNEMDLETLETLQTALAAVKPLKAEQISLGKIKTDTAKLAGLFKEYQSLQKSVYDLGDLPKRLSAVKEQVEAISATDPQKTAKIAAADKTLVIVEQEFTKKRARMLASDQARVISGFSNEGYPELGADFGKKTALERREILDNLQMILPERIDGLTSIIDTMKSETPPPNQIFMVIDESDLQNPAFPISVEVSRKDETVGGKKLLIITTVKKYPPGSVIESKPVENAVLVFDDKTLVMGERDTVVKAVETKTAESNRIAKSLIARSPDALIAFGANFRDVDLSEVTKFFGEQKNAWQLAGSLDSTGNDISLTAGFERSDVPVNVQAKKTGFESMVNAAPVPGNDETKALVESIFRSMIGIEAKITVRFDKQKTAALIEKSPSFLSKMLKR